MAYKTGDRVGLLDDGYEPYNMPGTIEGGPFEEDGAPYLVRFDGEESPRRIMQSVLAPWPHRFRHRCGEIDGDPKVAMFPCGRPAIRQQALWGKFEGTVVYLCDEHIQILNSAGNA